MSERIAEEKLIEIRQATDIVDLISDYMQLKKQGRNYVGLCPFHGEKTPSFSVSPDKQIYHCFGCGAGGNVLTFLMEIEGYTFQEAAIKLAERGNVELNIEMSQASRTKTISDEILQMIEAHELLRKFYHHLLVNTKEGQQALEYLLNRGFTKESIEKFQIGYALDSWDFVVKYLTKKKYSPELMERAGLIIKRENGHYFDRFRNRILFPILDRNGNTVAFSGRSLDGEEPKYLNSPETVLFNKSKVLYNYHQARSSIRKSQQVVLFEGFADVIAADRSGIENGIATMGTSLTEDHVAFLKRNVENVTICYDSDSAGIEAAFRAGNMLTEAGFAVKVSVMPSGMDPDDYVKTYGDEKFRNEIIAASHPFMSFKLLYYRKGKNLQIEGERLGYIETVVREISRLDKAVEKDHYLRQIAEEFSISLQALVEQEKQVARKNNRKVQKDQMRSTTAEQPPIPVRNHDSSIKPAYYNAERFLIAHMLKSSDIAYRVQERMDGKLFNIDEHQAIITYLYGYYEKGFSPDFNSFLSYLDDEKLRRIVVEIEMMPLNEDILEGELNDYIRQVLLHQQMLKIKEKEAELKDAERQSDLSRAVSLLSDIQKLRKSLTGFSY